MIVKKYPDATGLIIGTGPSLTPEQATIIAERQQDNPGFVTFGVNNAYTLPIHIDVFFACNFQWWDHYVDDLAPRRAKGMECWTWNQETASQYDLNHIEGRWSGGKRNVTSLSTDPSYIHFGHGSGYEVLGVAYHLGIRHMVLVGYDLRFPGGYNPANRNPGSGRHFFGEYPSGLRHWPGRSGENIDRQTGDLTGLLDCYRTIDCATLDLTITNCSPGSALDFFDTGDLEKVLDACV